MKFCQKCEAVMVRADMYDPDGEVPLYGGVKTGMGVWWVCISPGCEEGRKNCEVRKNE